MNKIIKVIKGEEQASSLIPKVPFKKTVITYKQWKDLHDKDQVKNCQYCLQDKLQYELLPSILKGLISTTTEIDNRLPDSIKQANDTVASAADIATSQGITRTADPLKNKTIKLEEFMFDTTLTYSIPLSYLKLRANECLSAINACKDIGSLQNSTYAKKLKLRKHVLEKLIKVITVHINFVTQFQADPEAQYFKPALRRCEPEYRFLCTNLIFNRFKIEESLYDTITFGMASDHVGGYKAGLLKFVCDSLHLSMNNHNTNANTNTRVPAFRGPEDPSKNSNSNSSNSDPIFDRNRYSNSMSHYFKLTYYKDKISQTKMLFDNEVYTISNEAHLRIYLDLIQDIINLCEDSNLHEIMGLFSQDCPQFSIWEQINQELINKSIEVQVSQVSNNSSTEHESDQTNDQTKNQNLKLLHEIAAQVLRLAISGLYLHDIVQDDISYTTENISTNSDPIDSNLHSSLDSEIAEAIFTEVSNPEEKRVTAETNFLLRRDVVFSQSISAVCLGSVVKITSELKNLDFWKQILNHGLLLQFETYVSTWRNEQAMLEDHSVGILTDISQNCRIKFTDIEEKSEPSSISEVPYFNPIITGSSSHVNIEIPLPREVINFVNENLGMNLLEKSVRLVTVVFNVGINEEQALADKLRESGGKSTYKRVRVLCATLRVAHSSSETTADQPSNFFFS